MPNRMIRHGYLDSERLADLNDHTERVFQRMLLACDDAGRMDGRPQSVYSTCFPVATNTSAVQIRDALDKIEAAGLILRYEWECKPYLQIMRTHRMGPGKKARFPWKDGTYEIAFVKVKTPAGDKDFVATSIPAEGMTVTQPEPSTAPLLADWKKWGPAELRASVEANNTDGLLRPEEVEDFLSYWLEPSAKGAPNFHAQKKWDTRRRMRNALAMIYEPKRERAAIRTSNRTPVPTLPRIGDLHSGRKP